MQLILKDNYIHLIVSLEDLERFREHNEVQESVVFGESFGDKFIYGIKTSHSYEDLHTTLIANELTIHIPKNTVKAWLSSEMDSFEAVMNMSEGRDLVIRVSKDPLQEIKRFMDQEKMGKPDKDFPI
ncbi:MAG: hypothetical protein AAFY71_28130 [Bacteroidota bacterium]